MTATCEPHRNLIWPADQPFPAGDSPYCHACWRAATTGPPAAIHLTCVHEGAVVEWCTTCGDGGEGRHVRDCAVHDRCSRSHRPDVPGLKSCDRCTDNPVIQVQTDGRGIGDAVSQLYACCGLADATGRPVVMRSRHDLGWFAGVSHPGLTILPHDGSGVECNPDYPGQCRAADDGSVSSRCQWYCDRLSDALGVPRFNPSRPRAVRRPPPVRESGYAVLSPFSLHTDREWPVERWREMAVGLNAKGLTVIALDRPGSDERLQAAFGTLPGWMQWHFGADPTWTASLIANADVFAGNDSGMAHVAGVYGVPGVVVMTMFPFDFVFGEAPSLTGVGRHRQPLGDVPVADAMTALGTLGPVDVAAAVRRHLGQRAATTEWLFDAIRQRWPNPRVVETGAVRSAWDWSAGYMTWLLGALLAEIGGGELVSVDNDRRHCQTARRLCSRWPHVLVADDDSVAYLSARTERIDVAYLDSLDTYEPGHAEHGLREAQAVEPLMSTGGLIVFDDTPRDGDGWSGKGRLAVPWLVSRGWRVRPESGYQCVLEMAGKPV